MHRANGAPLGKLYNKYHNWKHSLRSGGAVPDMRNKHGKGNTSHQVVDNEKEHIRALKFENLDAENKLLHWKGCAATRVNSIATENDRFFDIWPQYKEQSGYKLVIGLKSIITYNS